MDEKTIWTIIITAGLTLAATVVTTLMNHRLSLSKEKKLRKDELDLHARYLAIRVVCALEPFVNECCDVVVDEGEADAEGYSQAKVEDPKISFPNDVDWKTMSPDLMYRVLSLPNQLSIVEQAVTAIRNDHATPPDYEEYFDARIMLYSRLGLAALTLSDEIIAEYKIPRRNLGTYDRKGKLEKAFEQSKAKSDARQASQAELMKEIDEKT